MKTDPRMTQLAETVITYSLDVQPGEAVLIDSTDCCDDLANAMIKVILKVGGYPIVRRLSQEQQRIQLLNMTEEYAACLAGAELELMNRVQNYVAIRGSANQYELSDVPPEKNALYQKAMAPAREQRMFHTKWCVLRYPSPAMAQQCVLSTDAFEEYYFDCCCVDYHRMSAAAEPLKRLLAASDQVHIVGPGVDLRFSVKDRFGHSPFLNDTAIGRMNLPDGEVGGSVVPDSVQGTIAYNIPSTFQGTTFTGIRFTFRDGKIVEARCDDPAKEAKLNKILDTDPWARYIGEFSLGTNPKAVRPIGDILFDEKMWGSFHFTPGCSPSALHWDLVCCQRPEYGGGEIWLDGVCIRRDGRFLLPELEGLNPERLLEKDR